MKISKLIKSTTLVSALIISSMSFAANIDVNANDNDLAIHGYDTVSYFTKSKAVKGRQNYTATYKGAIYQFNSAKNRDMFKADPEMYAPQYGGFCAMGAAMKQKFDVDPKAFKIVQGKLYLNLNSDVQKAWSKDISGNLQTADRNWHGISEVSVKQLKAEAE